MPLATDDKFRELIIHIARRCESDSKFGATKLNKLLFFADFRAFKVTGESITGRGYQKLEHGPVPRALLPVRESMVADGDITVRSAAYYQYTQDKVIALRDPDLSNFTAEEIAIVDAVIDEYWEMSATEISRVSHEFMGWKAAEIGETIPYGLAWLTTERDLTEEERKAGRLLDPLTDEQKAQYA